ncbi:hypothetical protein KKF34_19450 [Myxococcota bacterium]|nr:hypothetical protein [Myxococcota bacterium]MBU1499065.1 hypothetical protein [Myxococcota bacterium]
MDKNNIEDITKTTDMPIMAGNADNVSDNSNEISDPSSEIAIDSEPGVSDTSPEMAIKSEPPEVKCSSCKKFTSSEDPFCTHCGAKILSSEEKEKKLKENQEFIDKLSTEARKSARGIIILGFLFAISGTIMGFINKKTTDDALNLVKHMEPTQKVDIGEKSYTVKELRRKINFEYYQVFVVNYFLSAVMFGLWFWARKNLFPAIVSALAVYIAVNIFNAFIDPSTLYKGLIIKIIIIGIFANGISKALKVRELSGLLKDYKK